MPHVRRLWLLALLATVVAACAMPAAPTTPTAAVLPAQAQVAPEPTTAATPAFVEPPAVASVAPLETADTAVPKPPEAPTATAPAAFDAAHAQAHVAALADPGIGSRPAGSPAQEAAVAYLSEQLRQWGYTPTVQRFPVRWYEDRGAQVAVVQPQAQTLDANTLAFSASGEAEAPVVHVGLGRQEDLRDVDLRGKIALIRRGEIFFRDKVANAAGAGAVAAVVYNNASGNVRGNLGETSAIPAATIPGEQGEALARQAEVGGLVLRVAVDGTVEEREGANVVATLPGSRPGSGAVTIGGHMDSVPEGPGANDNASGTAVVLELARVLAERGYPHDLRFVLFGAEELGLFGSRHYVAQLSEEERRSTLAMLNLDMVGVGDAWRFGGSPDLAQRALRVAQDLGLSAATMGERASGSDHASFLSVGIPALFIHRTDDPRYHTADDRTEFVDPAALAHAGEIALRVLEQLASEGR